LLGLDLERAWEYCEEPWLLCSIEWVYFFGGEGVLDYNIPTLGLVVINDVCMNGTFTYNNKIRSIKLLFICCEYSRIILAIFARYVV